MEAGIATLLAAIAVIVGASITYAKTIGPYQEAMSQVAIESFGVSSRYKKAVNLGVGLLLASILTVVAAYAIGNMIVIPAGLVAGIFASVEAQRVHDTTPSDEQPPTS
jgi:hypothetical protein